MSNPEKVVGISRVGRRRDLLTQFRNRFLGLAFGEQKAGLGDPGFQVLRPFSQYLAVQQGSFIYAM